MKSGYIKSSPRFFRMIKLALLAAVVILATLAILFPAPLQEQAQPGKVPNPMKSAWFLLWLQELVSYNKQLINLAAVAGAFFLLLPWLPWSARREQATWRPKEQLPVVIATLVAFILIVSLTILAACFRGENWAFGIFF